MIFVGAMERNWKNNAHALEDVYNDEEKLLYLSEWFDKNINAIPFDNLEYPDSIEYMGRRYSIDREIDFRSLGITALSRLQFLIAFDYDDLRKDVNNANYDMRSFSLDANQDGKIDGEHIAGFVIMNDRGNSLFFNRQGRLDANGNPHTVQWEYDSETNKVFNGVYFALIVHYEID